MDEGFPQSCWQRDDHCECNCYLPIGIEIQCLVLPGFYVRVWKVTRCSRTVRLWVDADNIEGDETRGGNQTARGTHILEKLVWFWKVFEWPYVLSYIWRMAASREKLRAGRVKKQLTRQPVKLVQPVSLPSKTKVREKVTIVARRPTALVEGTGRSMGMEVD